MPPHAQDQKRVCEAAGRDTQTEPGREGTREEQTTGTWADRKEGRESPVTLKERRDEGTRQKGGLPHGRAELQRAAVGAKVGAGKTGRREAERTGHRAPGVSGRAGPGIRRRAPQGARVGCE